MNIDYSKKLNSDEVNYLRTLTKEQLRNIKKDLLEKKSYYMSGHPHLYGVKTVQDNIANLIDMKTDLSFAREQNLTVAGNGSTYNKSVKGVIPEAMTYLFNYRVALKTEMKVKSKLLQVKLAELHTLEKEMVK